MIDAPGFSARSPRWTSVVSLPLDAASIARAAPESGPSVNAPTTIASASYVAGVVACTTRTWISGRWLPSEDCFSTARGPADAARLVMSLDLRVRQLAWVG